MPFLDRPDGRIRYEVHGAGFPVLLFAPGGLRSRLEMWPSPPGGPARPWVDWTRALPEAGFTAIAMDQRNAGESRTEIRADHGWHTYRRRPPGADGPPWLPAFHVLGGCIGGSFCLKAIEAAPDRVPPRCCRTRSAGIPNTPGTSPTAMPNGAASSAPPGRNWTKRRWPASAATCGTTISSSASARLRSRLPGADHAAARHRHPAPAATSTELAALLPGVEVLTEWRGPEHLEQQRSRVVDFLRRMTP